jgi:hypothetical protein
MAVNSPPRFIQGAATLLKEVSMGKTIEWDFTPKRDLIWE